MTELTLHLGVAADDRDQVVEWLERNRNLEVDEYADGWECWGERPGSDINDEDTLHLQIIWPDDMTSEAIQCFINLVTDYERGDTTLPLVPMQRQSSPAVNGTILSLTRTDDHAEEILAYHDGGQYRSAHHLVRF